MAAFLGLYVTLFLSTTPAISSLEYVNCSHMREGRRNRFIQELTKADKRGLNYDCAYEEQALSFLRSRTNFKLNKKKWFGEDFAEAEYERVYPKGEFKFRVFLQEAFFHWNPLFLQLRKRRVGCNYAYRKNRDEHKVACLFGGRRIKNLTTSKVYLK